MINYDETKEMTLGELMELMERLPKESYFVEYIPIDFEYKKLKDIQKMTIRNETEFAQYLSYLYCVYRKIEMRMAESRYPYVLPDKMVKPLSNNIRRSLTDIKEKYKTTSRNNFFKMYYTTKKLFLLYVEHIRNSIYYKADIGESSLLQNIYEVKCWLEELNNWYLIKVNRRWISWTRFFIVTPDRYETIVEKLRRTIKFTECPTVINNEIDEPYIENDANKKLRFGFVNMEGARVKSLPHDLNILELKCPKGCTEDRRRWICTTCGDYVKIENTNGWQYLVCYCGQKTYESTLLTCWQFNHKPEELKATTELKTSRTVGSDLERPVACSITKKNNKWEVNLYSTAEKPKESYFTDKSIQEVIEDLMKNPKNIGKILIQEHDLEPDQSKNLNKHNGVVHVATQDELDFKFYLILEVNYSHKDLIIWVEDSSTILYQCIDATSNKITLETLNERKYGLYRWTDVKYFERMFRLKMNQVHAIFENSEEKSNSLSVSGLDIDGFKSINYVRRAYSDPLILSRRLLGDPEVKLLVQIYSPFEKNATSFDIQDRDFIHIPKLVGEYKPRQDIMGIDLGSTRCVLAVSRNREIQIVPLDNATAGDLWTESVISFDGKQPIIGKAAIRRLKTKPDYVVFDAKLLYNVYNRNDKLKQSIWPFKFSFSKENQPYIELLTSSGLKELSLVDINKIFLERIKKAATEYMNGFDSENTVNKAVITVPRYPRPFNMSDPLICSTIEAANLAGIEIIDIIEETHADLLYYMSNEKYSEMIKPGTKIAIFDIGGGTCICKVYEISEREGKKYATCFMRSGWSTDMNYRYSGRSIDDIIIRELEKLIPEEWRSKLKLRILEAAKQIKDQLSFTEKIE